MKPYCNNCGRRCKETVIGLRDDLVVCSDKCVKDMTDKWGRSGMELSDFEDTINWDNFGPCAGL